MKRILIAGATGYLGRFAVKMFKKHGYYVRVLTRSAERLGQAGPLNSPKLSVDDYDDVFVGEVSDPRTLAGMLDGRDFVF